MRRVVGLERRIRAAERRVAATYGPPVRERTVVLDEPPVRLRVLAVGAGPPLIYLNALSAPGMGFAPLAGRLPGFRHYLIDLPGHGLAAPYRWQGRPVREQAVAVLTQTLDALDLEDATFVGNSLGGLFTLWLAADAPSRLTRAVIIGAPATALPGIRVIPAMAALTTRVRGSLVQCSMRLPSPRLVARAALADAIGADAARGMSDDLLDLHRLPLRIPGQAASYRALLRRLIDHRTPRPENVLTATELTSIATPVRFVWGARDVFCSPERGEAGVARLPHADLRRVPGGHSPWLDDADECASRIADFLAAR